MALVQSTVNKFENANSAPLTLNGVSASNWLVLLIATTAVPSGGLSGWSTAIAPTANGTCSAVAYYKQASAGTNSVTPTWGGSNWGTAVLLEWSGMTATPFDVAGGPTNGTTAQSSSVSTGALATASEVVFAVLSFDTNTGVANAGITDPPSGFTSLAVANNTVTDQGAEISYKQVSSSSSVSASWTWSDSSTAQSQSVIAAFKLSSGPTIKVSEDDLIVTDVVLRVIKRLKEDDLTVSDARLGTRVALREEDLALTDLRAKTAKLLREDDLTLIDGFIKTVVPSGNVRLKVLEDDLVITDLRGVTLIKVREDDLILIDPGAHRFWIQTVDQPLTLVDEFIKTVVQGGGVRTIITSDAVVIVDDAGQRYWMHRGLTTDNLVLSDAAVELLQRIRALSDQIIVSDGTVQIRLSRQVIADLIGTTDQVLAQYLPMVTYEVHIRIGAEPSPNVLGGYH